MNSYRATVIKTGNSIALRVPKQYAQDAHLIPGDKVELSLPRKKKLQDRIKIEQIIEKLNDINAFESIRDPRDWQHITREDRLLPGRG